jgi:hypothetical protein
MHDRLHTVSVGDDINIDAEVEWSHVDMNLADNIEDWEIGLAIEEREHSFHSPGSAISENGLV